MAYECELKKVGDTEFRCYFQLAQRITGGKWKPKVLFHLSMYEVVRFGALHRAMIDISEKMLIQALKELVKDGLVNRRVYREVPPKVEYSLTEMGKSFVPILNKMYEWGRSYASFLVARENGGKNYEAGMVFGDIDDLVKAEASV
ncbi:MAG: helix-turn-helix domain-containing protein [Desulfobacterales bacterium]|nr:helix-turn-helix domain-containing protein [Desulfobacterales bacterium]